MVVFTSSVQHAWILKRTRNCMFVPFLQTMVKKAMHNMTKIQRIWESANNRCFDRNSYDLAIFIWWIEMHSIWYKQRRFAKNSACEWLHWSQYPVCDRSIYCAQHTCALHTKYERKQITQLHLSTWKMISISHPKDTMQIQLYWQAYTHKRENFFSWFDRMWHNNDRKNSSFCRILHILFSRLSHFALGSFFLCEHIRVFWITFERGTNNTKPG